MYIHVHIHNYMCTYRYVYVHIYCLLFLIANDLKIKYVNTVACNYSADTVIHTHTNVHIYIDIHGNISKTCTHTYIHINIHVSIHLYTYIYIFIYIYYSIYLNISSVSISAIQSNQFSLMQKLTSQTIQIHIPLVIITICSSRDLSICYSFIIYHILSIHFFICNYVYNNI
jgi:hypothetical protein